MNSEPDPWRELSSLRSSVRGWQDDAPLDVDGPVGRIDDVWFPEADGDKLDDIAERAAEADDMMPPASSFYPAGRLVTEVERAVELLRSGDAVAVVVELPSGNRFGHLFERPVVPSDRFVEFARGIGVEVEAVGELSGDVFSGRFVPVAQERERWRIRVDAVID